eukprot:gnl/MRDRNA2_/MRDRNA2_129189_c0_seq1.p1 gnl/MRDRNA2_/MRDRNA2_129189_c0~~gnl/MRDRNA2_/MRDRNA2_129189_c0_seq1.p1  ORF type:complete len:463 (+),score=114.86 gnl/MRDRNA2_/MRDRNA2_129189_c0_seq1:76-1464(+)
MPDGAAAIAKVTSGLLSDDDEEVKNENSEASKFVASELEDAKNSGGNVSVDQKMQYGRKSNRGFTVAMGKPTAQTEEHQEFVRKDKRAHTLPTMQFRRSDYVLAEEALKTLAQNQKEFASRVKRGSISISFVPADHLEAHWKETCDCHVYGKMTEGQQPQDERERSTIGMNFDALPEKTPFPIASCMKGCKGRTDFSPNQDNFSITYCKNGWRIATCLDGHGPNGHIVATRGVQTLPYYIMTSSKFPDDMREALKEAFEMCQADLQAHALEEGYDVQASGSTIVSAVWKGNKLWTAHCGDSRLVIGYETDKRLQFETQDHKPDDPQEKKRIESSGGEVRTYKYDDGWCVHRIFVKDKDFPGLCMARSLGDVSVKDHGVIATPDVNEINIELAEKPFILMASDGIWEFLDSEFVIKAVVKKMPVDGAERIVQKLHREAIKRWRQEEGDYCDDITTVLVQLREE